MKQLVFDIETNGLKPTVVWCIVAKEIGKDELHVFDTSNLSGWNSFVRGFDEVIGHNLIGYDVPVCERLLDTDFTGIKVTDTLVMSRLANPQRDSHSLDSYGKELNNEKGNHTDWSCYSLEMLDYCKQDVKLSEQVYQ